MLTKSYLSGLPHTETARNIIGPMPVNELALKL